MAESVLLTARVRMKKREGTAEFSEKQLRWVPDASPSSSSGDKPVVVLWTSVQEQQVSSASSPRAMLRLRTAGGAALVLEFVSARALAHAFEVRDAAKALVARQLAVSGGQQQQQAPARRTAPLCTAAEIKQRAALLAAHPTLKRQHTEMVTDGLIAEEDFWASRRHLLADEASKRQKSAKTSAILTDLSGDNDAGNVVKYNLNAEVIHQIFIQYPAVHLAYEAQVPDRMSETEFWSTFFKSKYFHRDRKAGHEDLFTKYEETERVMARTATIDPRALVDPLVDLTSTEEDLSALQRALIKKTLPGGGAATAKDDASSITIAKFNRHGAYVLDPSHAGHLQAKSAAAVATKARPSFQDNVAQATLLDDLQRKAPPPYNPLTLEDESRYFQQQTQASGSGATLSLDEAAQRFKSVCSAPIPLAKAFPSARSSLEILNEIVACSDSGVDGAAGGSGGAFGSGAMTADFIPTEFKKQVYNQFHDVNELLRHFLSFKAKVAQGGDPHAQAKLDKIVDKMGAKYDELDRIRKNLPPHEKNLLAPLLKPFDDQLNLAFI